MIHHTKSIDTARRDLLFFVSKTLNLIPGVYVCLNELKKDTLELKVNQTYINTFKASNFELFNAQNCAKKAPTDQTLRLIYC